jgi:polyisoprenoid-binding protein YceI
MTNWKIDASHSEVQFKVKHLMISTVTGNFSSYEGSAETTSDTDFNGAIINFALNVDSISTGMEQRDGHLKSADFFDVSNFPTINFVSTSFNGTELVGDLTIKGVTKSVSLKTEFGGTMVDFYGQTKAGFEVEGKINRQDFGLTWAAVTEAGGVVVSDEVKLVMNIQLVKS